jgi:hypothetical protein
MSQSWIGFNSMFRTLKVEILYRKTIKDLFLLEKEKNANKEIEWWFRGVFFSYVQLQLVLRFFPITLWLKCYVVMPTCPQKICVWLNQILKITSLIDKDKKKITDEKSEFFSSSYIQLSFKLKSQVYIVKTERTKWYHFWGAKILIILITKPYGRFKHFFLRSRFLTRNTGNVYTM